MTEDARAVDIWTVLEDANVTVERWPEWLRRYDADVHYERDSADAHEER